MTASRNAVRSVRVHKGQGKVACVYLAPFLILLVTFSLFPIFSTFIISFLKWDGFTAPTFVGLDNYTRMFKSDSRFFLTIGNTFSILALSLPLNVILGLLAAHVLNSHMVLWKKFYQTAFFLPYVVTPVAIGLMWALLFDWKYGAVNNVLQSLGWITTPVNWLGDPVFARVVLSLILIWKNFGYTSVMFLAGISSISYDIFEAAQIEGATSFQMFRKITIPMLRPIITFIVVTGIISGLQLFDESYLLFSGGFSGPQPYGGPKLACLTMVMNFYDAGFRYFDLGFAGALAYGMFLVVLAFSLIVLKIMMSRED